MDGRHLKKTKIAEVITRLDKGGAPLMLLALLQGLSQEKFELVVIHGLTLDPQFGQREFEQSGIKQICLHFLRRNINLLYDVIAFAQLYTIFKREKFDIVHTHTSKAGALGRIAARLAGVPVIIHSPHGHVFYGYFGAKASKIIERIERVLSRFCDTITVLTEIEKNVMLAHQVAPAGKLKVVYNGIQFSRFREESFNVDEAKRMLGIPLDVALIGLVCRLDFVKGPLVFVDAARILCASHRPVYFIVAGEGDLRKKMELKAIELSVYDKMRFFGFCTNVPQIMRLLDVLVQPSLNEGFGLSILEALYMGIPVIATNVGGIPEILHDKVTGVLIPPNDAQALAQAISVILENKDMAAEMAKAGRVSVESRFSIEHMVQEFSELYCALFRKKVKQGR